MHYALLGDIHSSKDDLEKVLADILIKRRKPSSLAQAICLNVSLVKKNITDKKFTDLKRSCLFLKDFPSY